MCGDVVFIRRRPNNVFGVIVRDDFQLFERRIVIRYAIFQWIGHGVSFEFIASLLDGTP